MEIVFFLIVSVFTTNLVHYLQVHHDNQEVLTKFGFIPEAADSWTVQEWEIEDKSINALGPFLT